MKWTILWSSFAEKQIAGIHSFYLEETSPKVANKITQGLIKAPNILIKNPRLGQLEPSLIDLKIEYRYILYKTYKMVYRLNMENHEIRVVDVFNTRQNPTKLKRNT